MEQDQRNYITVKIPDLQEPQTVEGSSFMAVVRDEHLMHVSAVDLVYN